MVGRAAIMSPQCPLWTNVLVLMRILVKYPTKWRWPRFSQNLAKYIELCGNKANTKFLVTVDEDDPWPSGLDDLRSQVSLSVTPPMGKVAAINHGIPISGWDVLIVVSDDMTPVQRRWDERIREDMYHSPLAWMINYRTEPRLGNNWRDLITLPIMTSECYKYFGYVYNPVYKSEFCDNEQTEVVSSLDRLVHVDFSPIIHEWKKFQVDKLAKVNVEAGKLDRITYENRKLKNFK
jgi:hypothetical protein